MNENELEQLAIKELLREAEAHSLGTTRKEQKINKLVKPNKKFLSNTINAAMTHNKRAEERTQKNCRKKLKKLEDSRYTRVRKHEKHAVTSHTYTGSSSDTETEIITGDDSEIFRKRSSEQHTKQKAKKRRNNSVISAKEIQAKRIQYEQEEHYAKYFADLAAFALASESYNQVGKWLCYQALLAGSCDTYEQNYDVPYDYLAHHGIEVMEPLDTTKNNAISLSSDDEIKEELDLDNDALLVEANSILPNFESVQVVESCITLDSDEEEEKDETILPTELIKEELISLEEDALHTIELSDSSDNEDTKPSCDANGSIDLTSDD